MVIAVSFNASLDSRLRPFFGMWKLSSHDSLFINYVSHRSLHALMYKRFHIVTSMETTNLNDCPYERYTQYHDVNPSPFSLSKRLLNSSHDTNMKESSGKNHRKWLLVNQGNCCNSNFSYLEGYPINDMKMLAQHWQLHSFMWHFILSHCGVKSSTSFSNWGRFLKSGGVF